MKPAEVLDRAKLYVTQARERLNAYEAAVPVDPKASGEWVSLRANIESALSDLETLTKAP